MCRLLVYSAGLVSGSGARLGSGTECHVLARQRQSVILDEVRRTGAVRVSDLVDRLGVSDMTVRREIGRAHV